MCVLISSTTFTWNVSHFKKNSARCYHKCTYIFTWSTRYCRQILIRREFSRQIFEKYWSINFMDICPVAAELFHADGRTDMTKLTVAFRNFANVPEKVWKRAMAPFHSLCLSSKKIYVWQDGRRMLPRSVSLHILQTATARSVTGPRARNPGNRGYSPGKDRNISFLHRIYTWRPPNLVGLKRLGLEADFSHSLKNCRRPTLQPRRMAFPHVLHEKLVFVLKSNKCLF
jgi:hypothetical protein